MYLECTCADVSIDKWNELMANAKECDYDELVEKIRKKLPSLYESLCLRFYNPWRNDCKETETHYILVHSATEYFIRKD